MTRGAFERRAQQEVAGKVHAGHAHAGATRDFQIDDGQR